MRRYKFFFYPLLFALFIQTVKANEGETSIDVCLEMFQPLNRSEIQEIFSEGGITSNTRVRRAIFFL